MAFDSLRRSFSSLSLTKSNQLTSLDQHEPQNNPLIRESISAPMESSKDTSFDKFRPPPIPTELPVPVPYTKPKTLSRSLSKSLQSLKSTAVVSTFNESKKLKRSISTASSQAPVKKKKKLSFGKLFVYTKTATKFLHKKFTFNHQNYEIIMLNQHELNPMYKLVNLGQTQPDKDEDTENEYKEDPKDDLAGALLYIMNQSQNETSSVEDKETEAKISDTNNHAYATLNPGSVDIDSLISQLSQY